MKCRHVSLYDLCTNDPSQTSSTSSILSTDLFKSLELNHCSLNIKVPERSDGEDKDGVDDEDEDDSPRM